MSCFFSWRTVFIVVVMVIVIVGFGAILQQLPESMVITIGKPPHPASKDHQEMGETLRMIEERDLKLFKKWLEEEYESETLSEASKQRIRKLIRKVDNELKEMKHIIEETRSK